MCVMGSGVAIKTPAEYDVLPTVPLLPKPEATLFFQAFISYDCKMRKLAPAPQLEDVKEMLC